MDPITDAQLENLIAKSERLTALKTGTPGTELAAAVPAVPVSFGPLPDGSAFAMSAPLPGGGEALSLTRDLAGAVPLLLLEIGRLRAFARPAVPAPAV